MDHQVPQNSSLSLWARSGSRGRLRSVRDCLSGSTLVRPDLRGVGAHPVLAVKQRLDGIHSPRVGIDAPPLPALLDGDARPR